MTGRGIPPPRYSYGEIMASISSIAARRSDAIAKIRAIGSEFAETYGIEWDFSPFDRSMAKSDDFWVSVQLESCANLLEKVLARVLDEKHSYEEAVMHDANELADDYVSELESIVERPKRKVK